MSELPVELYYSIIPQVKGRRELGRLCRASRTFLTIAQPYLYESLRIVGPVSTVQLCLVLIRNPRLAELVREIVYEPFRDSFVKARLNKGQILPAFFRVFEAALKACTQLKRLSLKQEAGHDFVYSWVLHSVQSQLTHLSMVFVVDVSVIRFFRNQKTLKHFELLNKPAGVVMMNLIDGIMGDIQLESRMWDRPDPSPPALSVRAPFWVLNFFPDRPIKAYEPLYPVHIAYIPRFIDNLAHSNGTIEELELPIVELPSPVIFSCVARLSSLQEFRLVQSWQQDRLVVTADEDLNAGVIDTTTAMQEFLRTDILVSFQSLTSLHTFTYTVSRNTLDCPRDLRRQVSRALADACPSLLSIIFTSILDKSVWRSVPAGIAGRAISETFTSLISEPSSPVTP